MQVCGCLKFPTHSFRNKPESRNTCLWLLIKGQHQCTDCALPFTYQPHKMVRHTQIISWQQLTIILSVFDHFVGLALKGLILSESAIKASVIVFHSLVFEAGSTKYLKAKTKKKLVFT